MLFTALQQKERHRQKNVCIMTSGGFVIVVRNNSSIVSKLAVFRAYLVTILKALVWRLMLRLWNRNDLDRSSPVSISS